MPSTKLETVMVVGQNGPTLINKSDFDPDVHKLFVEEVEEPKAVVEAVEEEVVVEEVEEVEEAPKPKRQRK
jgi:hypothetical protein